MWQLLGVNQHRERLALRLIGIAFFALALYILVQIAVTLLTQTRPAPSIAGIVWLAGLSPGRSGFLGVWALVALRPWWVRQLQRPTTTYNDLTL